MTEDQEGEGDRHLCTGEGAAGVQGCCIRWGDSPGPRQEGGEEEEEEGGKRRKQKMWGWGRWRRKGTFLIALF